ncbi:CDP-alcohol phosphatidyltransferase family protein [Streptomyces sp. NPDC047002]|uniref:CDP-alcohol phosphatidyltransferase family protein n=1 Tax=Streptomyces sp. NPDC047002 TaxID=3155475 RepID=UPI0034540B7E
MLQPLTPPKAAAAAAGGGQDIAAAPPPRFWDARLARWLVRPLARTAVRPNHITTLRLALGLGAAWYAAGTGWWAQAAGAWLFALSNVIDHADGELARMTGRTSRAGHLYDIAVDCLVHVVFLAALGVGQRDVFGTAAAAVLGAVAGVCVGFIFLVRLLMTERAGKAGAPLPSLGGFDAEDVLYVLPFVALAHGLGVFLVLAAAGSAPSLVVTLVAWARLRRTHPAGPDSAPPGSPATLPTDRAGRSAPGRHTVEDMP